MSPWNRRDVLRATGGLALAGVAGCLGGDGPGGPDASTPTGSGGSSPTVESPAFEEGGAIPTRFSCDGEGASPPLSVGGVADDVASLALLLDDPDAPGRTFTHWLLWGVPPSTTSIPGSVPAGETVAGLDGARQGRNDAGVVGYSGPCPPRGDGAHTYRLRLLALAGSLDLPAGAGRSAFDDAVEGRTRAEAVLRGTYER